jgi:hypothetical protein
MLQKRLYSSIEEESSPSDKRTSNESKPYFMVALDEYLLEKLSRDLSQLATQHFPGT